MRDCVQQNPERISQRDVVSLNAVKMDLSVSARNVKRQGSYFAEHGESNHLQLASLPGALSICYIARVQNVNNSESTSPEAAFDERRLLHCVCQEFTCRHDLHEPTLRSRKDAD